VPDGDSHGWYLAVTSNRRIQGWRPGAVVRPDHRRRHRAGLPWLSFFCPACGQVGSVDPRTFDRHAAGSISSLSPSISCRRCSPNAPFAKLETLTAERP
jgi:hypothetical protein